MDTRAGFFNRKSMKATEACGGLKLRGFILEAHLDTLLWDTEGCNVTSISFPPIQLEIALSIG